MRSGLQLQHTQLPTQPVVALAPFQLSLLLQLGQLFLQEAVLVFHDQVTHSRDGVVIADQPSLQELR